MSVNTSTLYQLGTSGLQLTRLGLGTWQFSSGKGVLGGHWDPLPQTTMNAITDATLTGGINWFDTAESYGDGASERNLSSALKTLGVKPGQVSIADKWWPKQRKAQSILETIETRKTSLQGYPIDLYQIHWPESQSWLRTEMKALSKLVHEGHVRAVGLCNYSSKLLRKAHRYLAKQAVPLASIQVHYNLLHRDIEENDILRTANDLGVSVIAWSPLEQGLLTGRFHDDSSSMFKLRDSRKAMFGMSEEKLRHTRPLIMRLREIGEKYNASCGQISLAWLTQFHENQLFAIPGASSVAQAKENTAALKVTLTREELEEIDAIAWQCIRNK